MNDIKAVARTALSCLDLTSLNDGDTPEVIDALCDRALDDRLGVRPAAVCVYPKFVAQAVHRLQGSGIQVATVVNFPHGGTHWDSIMADTQRALADGADEIDFVIPFRTAIVGEMWIVRDLAEAMVRTCHTGEHPAHTKAILETGALEDVPVIRRAAECVVEAGVDFIKTSTGKVPVGATPEAVSTMFEVVVEHYRATGRLVGVKVSGGVRTTADAAQYLGIAEQALSPLGIAPGPANFRIGASSLYNDLASALGA